jgi:hypothetical protein
MADMRKYASGLLRPEDLHGGPQQFKIINVYVSEKLNAPILSFEGGQECVAWNNVCRTLTRAYGFEDTDWIGHTVELSVGTYRNKDGEEKENIQVKAVSSRDNKDQTVPIAKDLDDQVPF